MSSNNDQTITYTDKNYRALMAELKSLSTFTATADWDARARAELKSIVAAIRQLEADVVRQRQVIEETQKAHAEKSLIGRMFSGNKAEKEASQELELLQKHISTLELLAAELQDTIDMSPNSPEEQKALIKELRLRKKELQVRKKEITTAMKSIREDARQKTIHAGLGSLGIYDAKLASLERRVIRYRREAALHPNENEKAAIERQLLQVERDILGVERFKE
jgi:hypothetical protein